MGLGLYALVNDLEDGSISQEGMNNLAGIAQNGFGNTGIIEQHGDGHAATLEQNGNNNSYGIFQFGNGASSAVQQNGNGQAGVTARLRLVRHDAAGSSPAQRGRGPPKAVEGASDGAEPSHAPSTMLRMVPLPVASRRGGARRRTPARYDRSRVRLHRQAAVVHLDLEARLLLRLIEPVSDDCDDDDQRADDQVEHVAVHEIPG